MTELLEKIRNIGMTGKSLLRLLDLSDKQMLDLVDLAIDLKGRKKANGHLVNPFLRGRNICLIFQKSSTRTRCATLCAVRSPYFRYTVWDQ